MKRESESGDLLKKLEERALEEAAGEVLEPSSTYAQRSTAPATTRSRTSRWAVTLRNDRPPAFTGSDGQPYTVGVDTEETGDPARPFVGFLVFLRWAGPAPGSWSTSSRAICRPAPQRTKQCGRLDLSLFEVKAELDAAIERRRKELEDIDAEGRDPVDE